MSEAGKAHNPMTIWKPAEDAGPEGLGRELGDDRLLDRVEGGLVDAVRGRRARR